MKAGRQEEPGEEIKIKGEKTTLCNLLFANETDREH